MGTDVYTVFLCFLFHLQINDCCRAIMQKWLQGYQSAVGPVTWETLLSAMAEVEDLAVLTAEIRGEM